MAHARVNPFLDGAPQIAQSPARLVHTRERNVRVDIATAEEYRRALQRSRVSSRSLIRTDESGAQSSHRQGSCCSDSRKAAASPSNSLPGTRGATAAGPVCGAIFL